MNLRNLGIVFSPTLAIPAPLFSLLLAEFDLVFAVEKETGLSRPITLDDEPEEVRSRSLSPSPGTRRTVPRCLAGRGDAHTSAPAVSLEP
jgi:hypothetical protein